MVPNRAKHHIFRPQEWINQFQSSVAFHIETSRLQRNQWNAALAESIKINSIFSFLLVSSLDKQVGRTEKEITDKCGWADG